MGAMTSLPPPRSLAPEIAARLQRAADGRVPAIAHPPPTGDVLTGDTGSVAPARNQ
jgi:phosphoribosyl-AMP cyclohydrolase